MDALCRGCVSLPTEKAGMTGRRLNRHARWGAWGARHEAMQSTDAALLVHPGAGRLAPHALRHMPLIMTGHNICQSGQYSRD